MCSCASAVSGDTAASLPSASFIAATACGISSAIFANAGSCCTSWLFMRVISPSTCSRRRACDSATTFELCFSLSGVNVLRSRCTLNVAEMIWRCCSESCSTWPPAAAATAPAAALGLRLAEVLGEGAHAQEVQVARGALGAGGAVVVHGARVVGHRVAHLDAQLLHVEGVAGRHFRQPPLAAKELHHLLFAAVHGVDQLQVAHAEVVHGLGLDEHFLDGRRGGVAARTDERHRGRTVFQNVHRVLRRRRHALAVRRNQLHVIEAVALGGEAGHERSVGLRRQLGELVLAEGQAARRGLHRREHLHAHLGALQHRHVAAVLDLLRLEPRVGRELELQRDALGVGHLHDLHREDGRAHTVGLHVIVQLRVDVEDHRLVGAVLRRARAESARTCRPRRRVISVASSESNPSSLAAMVWSEPLGTDVLPGFTSME